MSNEKCNLPDFIVKTRMKNNNLIFGKMKTHKKMYWYNLDKNYNITFQNELERNC